LHSAAVRARAARWSEWQAGSRTGGARWCPSAHPGARGITPAQRRETSWQLSHDAHALIGAHSHPALDFRKAAPATDTKRRSRIDSAHFVAGALDGAQGVVGAVGGAKIKIAARKANAVATRRPCRRR